MPTTGYIMVHSGYVGLEKDREWMSDFGCTEIIEERPEHEKLRSWSRLDRDNPVSTTTMMYINYKRPLYKRIPRGDKTA